VISNNPSRAKKHARGNHLYAERHFIECFFATLKQSNHLSDEGVREFNPWRMRAWFDDRRRTLEIFLRSFKHRIDSSTSA
jgi:hypothetical protein